MPDIIFYEAFKEEQFFLKKHLSSKIKARFVSKTIQEAGHKKSPAKLISIRTQSKIPQGWADQIDGILSRSTGYDHLADYRTKTKTQAACGYLPKYCARAVAEHVAWVLLMLMQKGKRQLRQFETFHRDGLTGCELKEKNCLVIGVGNIGSQIVDVAKGLGMNVKGVDIKPKLKRIPHVPLARGLPWADVIICALPLTDKTKNMLNFKVLKKAKRGAIFINVGRAETSPVKDLKRLLDKGTLGGLSLDVYEHEGDLAAQLRAKKKTHDQNAKAILSLNKRDNVVFTPHNAFNTKESTERKAKQSAESIAHFLKKKRFTHPIPLA